MKLHFSVFISKVGAKPRFEKEAGGGSEMPSFNLNFVHCSQNNEYLFSSHLSPSRLSWEHSVVPKFHPLFAHPGTRCI